MAKVTAGDVAAALIASGIPLLLVAGLGAPFLVSWGISASTLLLIASVGRKEKERRAE